MSRLRLARNSILHNIIILSFVVCHTIGLGGAVVGRRTRDSKVASSTHGRSVIQSTRSTQPSIPRG